MCHDHVPAGTHKYLLFTFQIREHNNLDIVFYSKNELLINYPTRCEPEEIYKQQVKVVICKSPSDFLTMEPKKKIEFQL